MKASRAMFWIVIAERVAAVVHAMVTIGAIPIAHVADTL